MTRNTMLLPHSVSVLGMPVSGGGQYLFVEPACAAVGRTKSFGARGESRMVLVMVLMMMPMVMPIPIPNYESKGDDEIVPLSKGGRVKKIIGKTTSPTDEEVVKAYVKSQGTEKEYKKTHSNQLRLS